MAISINGFQVLLGLELLFEVEYVLIPFLEFLYMFGQDPHMILAATKGNGDGGDGGLLLAFQL